jgi:hypothetical protein
VDSGYCSRARITINTIFNLVLESELIMILRSHSNFLHTEI